MDTQSGIYQITNRQNGNRYVGSAMNLSRRWILHVRRLNDKKHHCHHLQAAWNLYGCDCFSFSVIEYCDIDKLIEREQYFIDQLRPEYNVSPTAGSRLGVKEREETKAKKAQKSRGRVMSEDAMQNRRVTRIMQDTNHKYTRDSVKKFLRELDEISEAIILHDCTSLAEITELDKQARVLWNKYIIMVQL